MEQEGLMLDFETGEIKRGDKVLMRLDELLYLLQSAVKYQSLAPTPEAETFLSELRGTIGAVFSKEQFQKFKELLGDIEEY